MVQVNNKVLEEISQKSPTAEAFFTYAACRERNARSGVSKLPTIRHQMLQEGFSPVPQDLLSMFRELERAGVGQLRGDSFKWNVSIKKIGTAAASPSKPEKIKEPSPIPQAKKSLVVFFDNHKEVTVSFTPGLTQANIDLLIEKLLTELE